MEAFVQLFNKNFQTVIHFISIIVEIAGLIVIFLSVIRALIHYFQKNERVGIELGKGLMLGIEIKIGAEVIHTLTADSLNDLLFLAIVVAIRVVLTIVLHWEITSAEKEAREEEMHRLALKKATEEGETPSVEEEKPEDKA